jgi:hypothetical protein
MRYLRNTRGFSRKDCVKGETSGDSKYNGRNKELPDGLASSSGQTGGLQVSMNLALERAHRPIQLRTGGGGDEKEKIISSENNCAHMC